MTTRTLSPDRTLVLLGALLATVAAMLGGRTLEPFVPSPGGGASEVAAQRSYGDLPFAFEPAAGRYGPGVHFAAEAGAGSAFMTDEGLTLSAQTGRGTSEAITVAPLGADLSEASGLEKLPGVVSDLRGDDPAEWRTDLPTFERVRYQGAYPGIDLDFHGKQGKLEYDFRLAPGADPSQIALGVRDADSVRLDRAGNLEITSGEATFAQKAPFAYQRSAGEDVPVDSSFTLDGRTVRFEVGAYDRSRPLVIDPLILTYSTYLGGESIDGARAITVDSSGAAYVTGLTGSPDFPFVPTIEPQTAATGVVFVSKLNAAGSALIYSTYLGGNAGDQAMDIAVDSAGSPYITGYTSSTDFPTVNPIEGNEGHNDVFIAKLNPAGNDLVYSTYLGGASIDQAQAIAVDASGAAYITGDTASPDFNTVSPIEGSSTGQNGQYDAFVAKLNPAGSALTYSTYLGGASYDGATGIGVDTTGAAYVTGYTSSADFNTVGPIQGPGPAGDGSAFVSKLNAAGSALDYSTYLGGNGRDLGNAIVVDSTGAAYVAGETNSTDFPKVNQVEGNDDESDAFVSKLNPAGSALAYSTYLGGDQEDFATDMVVASSGAAYLTGWTQSTDFDTIKEFEEDEDYPGYPDVFVSVLDPTGSDLTFSTYLGGDEEDAVSGIAVDGSGGIYVAGDTLSTDFDMRGPIDEDYEDGEAFITKFGISDDDEPPQTDLTDGPPNSTTSRKARFKFTGDDNVSPEESLTFECKLDARPLTPCTSPEVANGLKPGKHNFRVVASDEVGNEDPTPAKDSWKVVRG